MSSSTLASTAAGRIQSATDQILLTLQQGRRMHLAMFDFAAAVQRDPQSVQHATTDLCSTLREGFRQLRAANASPLQVRVPVSVPAPAPKTDAKKAAPVAPHTPESVPSTPVIAKTSEPKPSAATDQPLAGLTTRDENGKWHYRIQAVDGPTVTGLAFATSARAQTAAASFLRAATNENQWVIPEAGDSEGGVYRFSIRAANHRNLWTSPDYASEQAMKAAISKLKSAISALT